MCTEYKSTPLHRLPPNVAPVSYTHLDVYKRQPTCKVHLNLFCVCKFTRAGKFDHELENDSHH